MRVLTFGTELVDRLRFGFCLIAAMNGSAMDGAGQGKQRSWEEQRADGKVMRALKLASNETITRQGQGDEVRQRILKPEGGVVQLTGEQHDKLKMWWGRIQWPTFDIDDVEDAYEWLCSAPDEKPNAGS